MSQFLDRFNDVDSTPLVSHIPDVGDGWVSVSLNNANIQSGEVSSSHANNIFTADKGSAWGNKQIVRADLSLKTTSATGLCGPIVRYSPGNAYTAGYDVNTGKWELRRTALNQYGNTTTISLVSAASPFVAGNYFVRLSANGTRITVRVRNKGTKQWLNASGGWQSGKCFFADIQDSLVTGGAPGMWLTNSYFPNGITFKKFRAV